MEKFAKMFANMLNEKFTFLYHDYDEFAGVHYFYCEVHGRCLVFGNDIEGEGYWVAPLIDGVMDWDNIIMRDTIPAIIEAV